MIKKALSLLIIISLIFSGCANSNTAKDNTESSSLQIINDNNEFASLNDAKLMQYVQDEMYADLEAELGDDYVINDIDTIYVSKEYIDQLEFNSQKNIFFGYTLEEIANKFQGDKYIFTVDDDGKTVVKKFEKYDDSYEKALKNVAIGSGVILVCVTVSLATGGAAPAVSAVFAASAKTGTAFALSSGALSGAVAGVAKGIKTKNVDSALKAAALTGSNSFKWGAIMGSVIGGADKAITIYKSAKTIPTPREAELNAFKQYGGEEQVTYFQGEKVIGQAPEGASRPDIVRMVDDHLEAIEVKCYNLESEKSVSNLYTVLEKQVASRVNNMPAGTTQRIVLNTQGRNYSTEYVEEIVENIQEVCSAVYQDIPVDIMPYVLN